MEDTIVNTQLLEIKNLSIEFRNDGNSRTVINNVSYSLLRGRTLGIVGESGSGKSVSSMAIMRLLPTNATITSGQILFHGHRVDEVYASTNDSTERRTPIDLVKVPEHRMREYRGNRISMIFQEPMTSLNPVQKCGAQVVEMLRLHEEVSYQEAKARVIELFNEVLLPRPEKIFDSYPHEISGGQKQRVMIAMALVCNPDLIIADEPTTALDVTVQKTIIDLLKDLQKKFQMGIIFISHDLGVIAQIADDVAVMYKGEIVEQGSMDQILHHPQHPYTQGLLACRPPLSGRPKHLPTVAEFLEGTRGEASLMAEAEPVSEDCLNEPQSVLLKVRDLDVVYSNGRKFFSRKRQGFHALKKINFDVYKGETLGLVGESGCGKTTLGRTLLRLITHSSGLIEYNGIRLDQMTPSQMRQLRTQLQIVFQDPYSSLNPRLTIGQAIMEPLIVNNCNPIPIQGEDPNHPLSAKERVLALMEQVGLDRSWYNRYPHEFSGGQRQRVCIARALIVNPELVVCDESVSALDVSVQAQVLNLLNDLKRQYRFTYVFISHDLSVVRFISDRIMVMQKGDIVECGPADQIFFHPEKEYTKNLIAAIPKL